MSDMSMQKRSPAKGQRSVVTKGSVAILKESTQMGFVPQESYAIISIPREPGKLGSKHAIKFSKSPWHQIVTRERKGPSRGIIQKCEPQERLPCALKSGERSHEETLHQEGCAAQSSVGFGKTNFNKLKHFGQNYVPQSCWSLGFAGKLFDKTRGARIRSRFRSINAHDEQKRIMLRRDGHSEKVQNPHCGVDCQWRSARLEPVRRRATTRRNASCPIAGQPLRRPRILLWEGQRSKATVGQRWEENYLQAGQFWKLLSQLFQFRKQFVFCNATRIVGTRATSQVTGNTAAASSSSDSVSERSDELPANISQDSDSEHPIKSGNEIEDAQYFHSLLKRPELRRLLENQNNISLLQETHWRSLPRAENFGNLISADHKVLNEGCESRDNHWYAVVVQDLATQWSQLYPCKTKTSQETQRSLQKFLEPKAVVVQDLATQWIQFLSV